MIPEEEFANDVLSYALKKAAHLKFEDYGRYFREVAAAAQSEADESDLYVEVVEWDII